MIDGSRLEVMEGCGHFPYAEHPRQFTKLVVDFMNSTTAASIHSADLNRILSEQAEENASLQAPAQGS